MAVVPDGTTLSSLLRLKGDRPRGHADREHSFLPCRLLDKWVAVVYYGCILDTRGMIMSKKCLTMDKLVSHCKTVGFVYPGSDIYGGLANTWDYGPLGVELKNNVKKSWWKRFVQESANSYGVDAAILMNSRVWDGAHRLFLRPQDGLQGVQDPLSCGQPHRGALQRCG